MTPKTMYGFATTGILFWLLTLATADQNQVKEQVLGILHDGSPKYISCGNIQCDVNAGQFCHRGLNPNRPSCQQCKGSCGKIHGNEDDPDCIQKCGVYLSRESFRERLQELNLSVETSTNPTTQGAVGPVTCYDYTFWILFIVSMTLAAVLIFGTYLACQNRRLLRKKLRMKGGISDSESSSRSSVSEGCFCMDCCSFGSSQDDNLQPVDGYAPRPPQNTQIELQPLTQTSRNSPIDDPDVSHGGTSYNRQIPENMGRNQRDFAHNQSVNEFQSMSSTRHSPPHTNTSVNSSVPNVSSSENRQQQQQQPEERSRSFTHRDGRHAPTGITSIHPGNPSTAQSSQNSVQLELQSTGGRGTGRFVQPESSIRQQARNGSGRTSGYSTPVQNTEHSA